MSAKHNYSTEQLKSMEYHYQGKTMTYEEAAAALGQGSADDASKSRVILKMLNKAGSKMKIVGDKKKSYDQKVIEAVYEEIAVEDTIAVLDEIAIINSEEKRAQKAESKGDVVYPVKNLTITDIDQANSLENWLNKKAIRFARVPGAQGESIFVLQNITDTDVNKINGHLGRYELGVKADAATKATFDATAVATKGIIQATGKVTAGVVNVTTSTVVQTGKSLVDIGSSAYVNARKEAMKQKQKLAVDAEFLEASAAMKRGMSTLKSKLGFGSSKERAGWS